MQFRTAHSIVVLTLLLASLTLLGTSARDFDEVQIETTRVAEGVYMLTGAGGNIGVSAGKDGVFLIDDQFAPLTEKIKAAVAKISDGEIRFVLNTHWHGDHTGGNEKLGEAGALVVAHDNVRARMSVEQFIEALDNRVPPHPEAALPVVTFNDTATFHRNGDEIHAFHVPRAHTDGDSIVHFRKANVVHLGDVYWSDSYPFIDLSSGGSLDGVIAAVETVLALADDRTRLIPGHGSLSDRKGLIAYRDLLRAVRAKIAPLVAAGRSLEQVQAARATEAFDDEWGAGFIDPEAFVTSIYQSLSAKD